MNWIDRAIATFSPETALRRTRARVALGAIEHFAYDGAKPSRRTDGWFRPGTDANTEAGSGLAKLRDGARDLVRNNPLARKAVNELSTKAVKTGIWPQARTGNDRVDKTLDDLFAEWAPVCNADGNPGFGGLQRLAASCIIVSGECVMRTRPRRQKDGLKVPVQLQLLEPDYIDHTKNEETDTGYIVQGVEFDMIGREIAYWMYGTHPGSTINAKWWKNASNVAKRMPASGPTALDRITRGFDRERVGQVRGVSWFAPVVTALYDLDGYEDAEQVRKRTEACLALILESPETGDGTPIIGKQTADDENRLIEEIAPGMIMRTRPGESATVLEPKSSGGYAEYVRSRQRVIAAGLGIPHEVLTGDLSQINYSSYRGGLIGFKDHIEQFQWNVLIPFVGDPVWRAFVDACILAGLVPEGTSYQVEWAEPSFDLLDRAAESKADEQEIRIGTMTWAQAVGRKGLDPRKQLEQIADWNGKFDAAGVILDCDPRNTTRQGAVQSAPADQQPTGGANG